MRVSLGETMKKFRRRNLATGVSTSEARRQEAEYDQALQGMRTTGIQDTARIQEEGAMNRLMAGQEFDQPLRDEEVKAGRLGNESRRFARGIEQDYGEGAVRTDLGLPPIESRANVFYPERIVPGGTRPKADVASPAFSGGGGEFGGTGSSGTWGMTKKKKKPTLLESFMSSFRRPATKFRM